MTEWNHCACGRFSKSRGLSASVSFLSSPPPPPSFTRFIFALQFFAPEPHRNACYAGYVAARKINLWAALVIFVPRAHDLSGLPQGYRSRRPEGSWALGRDCLLIALDLNITFMQTPPVKHFKLIITKTTNGNLAITCLQPLIFPLGWVWRVVSLDVFHRDQRAYLQECSFSLFPSLGITASIIFCC